MEATTAIHGAMTINEAVRARPETVATFHAFGMDACCGGGLPIREAAERHGLDPEAVLAALNAPGGA